MPRTSRLRFAAPVGGSSRLCTSAAIARSRRTLSCSTARSVKRAFSSIKANTSPELLKTCRSAVVYSLTTGWRSQQEHADEFVLRAQRNHRLDSG